MAKIDIFCHNLEFCHTKFDSIYPLDISPVLEGSNIDIDFYYTQIESTYPPYLDTLGIIHNFQCIAESTILNSPTFEVRTPSVSSLVSLLTNFSSLTNLSSSVFLVEVQLAKIFYGVSYTLPLDGMRQFATFINITDWLNLEENSTQFYFYKKNLFPWNKGVYRVTIYFERQLPTN